MPVLKSSKKALAVSKRRKRENDSTRFRLVTAFKELRTNPTTDNLTKVYSLVDRAAKKHLFHKNKAARLKSSYAKLVSALNKKSPKK